MRRVFQSLSRVQFQICLDSQRVRCITVCLNLSLVLAACQRAECCWQRRELFLDSPRLGFKMQFHDSC